jgi:hypothetical protein
VTHCRPIEIFLLDHIGRPGTDLCGRQHAPCAETLGGNCHFSAREIHRHETSPVKQFISAMASTIKEVDEAGADTGRLMTVFNISLQSVKKIQTADLLVGVDGAVAGTAGPLVITKIRDPNTAFPNRQKEILQRIGKLHGKPFTAHAFQAICYKYGLKNDAAYCWKSVVGGLTTYSNETIQKIKSLSPQDVEAAVEFYSKRFKTK